MERIGERELGPVSWTDAGFGTWHARVIGRPSPPTPIELAQFEAALTSASATT